MKKPPPKNGFKKGQSGNPGGRKAMPAEIKELRHQCGEQFSKTLYKYLGTPVSELKELGAIAETLSWSEVMILRAVERTIDGDMRAITDVWERAYGKPVQPHEGSDGQAINFNIFSKELLSEGQ